MASALNVIFAVQFYRQNKCVAEFSYIEFIQNQRIEREKRLVANPRNWFSLVGLFPILEGINLLGGNETNSVIIPGTPLTAYATLELTDHKVILKDGSSSLLINGNTFESRVLNSDHDDKPDILSIGPIQMMLLQRGEQFFIRAWDTQSVNITEFAGLNYFQVNPAWRVQAEFKPFTEPRVLPVEDVIGTKYEVKFAGQAFFNVQGIPCSLIAEDDEEELLFSFSDLTKSDSTYPAGRYLLTGKPADNRVTLDFNLAHNWPCAYTPYATCPLPPFENHLKVRIEAGEKRYH